MTKTTYERAIKAVKDGKRWKKDPPFRHYKLHFDYYTILAYRSAANSKEWVAHKKGCMKKRFTGKSRSDAAIKCLMSIYTEEFDQNAEG